MINKLDVTILRWGRRDDSQLVNSEKFERLKAVNQVVKWKVDLINKLDEQILELEETSEVCRKLLSLKSRKRT